MKANNKMILKTLLVSAVVVLTGCAATQTALEHGSLQVSTKQGSCGRTTKSVNSERSRQLSCNLTQRWKFKLT